MDLQHSYAKKKEMRRNEENVPEAWADNTRRHCRCFIKGPNMNFTAGQRSRTQSGPLGFLHKAAALTSETSSSEKCVCEPGSPELWLHRIQFLEAPGLTGTDVLGFTDTDVTGDDRAN